MAAIISDARRVDGEYQKEVIYWFMDQNIDTSVVVHDSLRVYSIFASIYLLTWLEAIPSGRDDVPFVIKGDHFVTRRRFKLTKNFPDWTKK